MSHDATIDFETRSEADLKKVGAWPYSEHPSTDIICMSYGLDADPIQDWWPEQFDDLVGEPAMETLPNGMPRDLYEHILAGGLVEAHHVAFEKSIWANICVKRWGWPPIPGHQWRDTMAVACYYALPAGLDQLARVLGFEQKNAEGSRLITKYSKLHLKTAKRDIPADDFRKFVAYCNHDVAMEQSISDYLGDLPERELPAFMLDQKVNMRGLLLDLEGIEAATEIVDQRAAVLTKEFLEITSPTELAKDGIKPTQRDKYLAWLAEHQVALDDLSKDTVEEVLDEGITYPGSDHPVPLGQGPVRRTLEIRRAINKASTKKLDAMARQRGVDGRARFQARYHGTGTGRDTASGFQVYNLVRGYEKIPPEQLVGDIMKRDAELLDVLYGDATAAISKASRHWITAAPGYRILAGDFVSIEAVVLACLAGEQWKIDAFHRKEPIYERMADKIYRLPAGTVTKDTHPHERQDGKIGELAFGYQGGLNAWLNFDNSGRHSDERINEIKDAWRYEHPMTTDMWRGLENASLEAVLGSRETSYRDIGFEPVDEWLSMILPNGKRIWYWKPDVRMGMPQWHTPQEPLDKDGEPNPCHTGDCDCRPRAQLTYMAQKFGQWRRVHTYGGKITENAVQATSREILMPAIYAVEDAGYPVILKVYDEIVAEAPDGFGSKKEFEDIMRQSAGGDWSRGWPIHVDAWEGRRYRK